MTTKHTPPPGRQMLLGGVDPFPADVEGHEEARMRARAHKLWWATVQEPFLEEDAPRQPAEKIANAYRGRVKDERGVCTFRQLTAREYLETAQALAEMSIEARRAHILAAVDPPPAQPASPPAEEPEEKNEDDGATQGDPRPWAWSLDEEHWTVSYASRAEALADAAEAAWQEIEGDPKVCVGRSVPAPELATVLRGQQMLDLMAEWWAEEHAAPWELVEEMISNVDQAAVEELGQLLRNVVSHWEAMRCRRSDLFFIEDTELVELRLVLAFDERGEPSGLESWEVVG